MKNNDNELFDKLTGLSSNLSWWLNQIPRPELKYTKNMTVDALIVALNDCHEKYAPKNDAEAWLKLKELLSAQGYDFFTQPDTNSTKQDLENNNELFKGDIFDLCELK